MARNNSFMDSDNDMSCKNIKMFVQIDLQIKKKKKKGMPKGKNGFASDFSSSTSKSGWQQNKYYNSSIWDNFLFQNYEIIDNNYKIIKG